MSDDRTTAVVQRYLDALAADAPADPVIRDLLDRAVPGPNHQREFLCIECSQI